MRRKLRPVAVAQEDTQGEQAVAPMPECMDEDALMFEDEQNEPEFEDDGESAFDEETDDANVRAEMQTDEEIDAQLEEEAKPSLQTADAEFLSQVAKKFGVKI